MGVLFSRCKKKSVSLHDLTNYREIRNEEWTKIVKLQSPFEELLLLDLHFIKAKVVKLLLSNGDILHFGDYTFDDAALERSRNDLSPFDGINMSEETKKSAIRFQRGMLRDSIMMEIRNYNQLPKNVQEIIAKFLCD